MGMTPAEFAAKWKANTTKETAGSKEHFIDLCRMLGFPTPTEADPTGDFYAFEKGLTKSTGGGGFADVWKKGFFAWEYKGPKKDLSAAYQQLLQYHDALGNPPLLVVSDMDRFVVHTKFTNTVATTHEFTLDDLEKDPKEPLRILRAVMGNPEVLKPTETRDELTAKAAGKFASLAQSIQGRGHEPQATAHFLNKLLFSLFAEDAGLLPNRLLSRLMESTEKEPMSFAAGLTDLFTLMTENGGLYGVERIQWFNGGLFDGADVIALTTDEIKILREVSRLDWSQVEPAIFGTLFERGLDPAKRSQLGAHYTDRGSIERLVEPVVIGPLKREFEAMKAKVAEIGPHRPTIATTPFDKHPRKQFEAFLERLRSVTVLDPACGSGNFLYIALQQLKDLEREAIIWGSTTLRTPMEFPRVGPEAVKGIEISPYAAEIARVVIWIGEIQWMLNNGFAYRKNPILSKLDAIENRDALLDWTDKDHPVEADWPDATFIVGNPPFIGGKLMRTYLTDAYVDHLFRVFNARVPREADFVTYWHEKARAMIEAGHVERVGLLATQGIRGGANRRVLERIKETGEIYAAWSDQPWILDGAAVHVSFVAYDNGSEPGRHLNGEAVQAINANLTAGTDLTKAQRLPETLGIAFMGDTKVGPFDIPDEVAQRLLAAPNPDGRTNREVVRPWINGLDITRRPRNYWIIDFGTQMLVSEAAMYEAPFEYVLEKVRPFRIEARSGDRTGVSWWLHQRPRPDMREAIQPLSRYICTPRVSKHRLFQWFHPRVLPDSATIAIARDDDYTFGVLHSRVHELWARGMGTQLREVESGFRYTPTTTFETFPFPRPSDEQREAIAEAARELDRLREGWVNPEGASAKELERRTLTNLYNERPSWLAQVHERLDQAVLAAYGWPADISTDELLTRLLALNLAQAA
jgi:type II restriction/modification system DNA methylase subunit YeeA